MSQSGSALLEDIARRDPLECLSIESGPAYFETRAGLRSDGNAAISISRSSIAIRFDGDKNITVPKAAYGESNGRIVALDGAWSAPRVNDAGAASGGGHLFGTMALEVGPEADQDVAATRIVVAGCAWKGSAVLGDRRVIAHPLSRDAVSHHDLRMSITTEGALDQAAIDTMERACSFVGGIGVEVLSVESYSAEGILIRVKHQRGYQRVGRGPHSPFTGVSDEHWMLAWSALVEAFPRLLDDGIPIDMIIDQIAAHNQVPQIHVGAQLLLLATMTAAYQKMHGEQAGEGAATRRPELSLLNRELELGLGDEELDRFENLRIELLDTGFFHKPGYETGRPQQDVKFLRDIAHVIVFRLCGYSGPFYGAEKFDILDLAPVAS